MSIRAQDRTIVMYDAGRIMHQAIEFENVVTDLGREHVLKRVAEMNQHIRDLHQYFDGEVTEAQLVAQDVNGGRIVLTEGVLSLTVDYYLSVTELHYLKDIDPYLIAIM